MLHEVRKPVFRNSDKVWAAQLLNMARDLKIQIEEEEVLYYPGTKNKDSDQLRSYCKADRHLRFWHMQGANFLMMGLISIHLDSWFLGPEIWTQHYYRSL